MPRPKEGRTEWLQIALTPREKAYIAREAQRTGQTWSAYGRMVIVTHIRERIIQEAERSADRSRTAATG